MRYNGKYATQSRDLVVQKKTNKFVDGSVIISQGDSIVHVSILLSYQQEKEAAIQTKTRVYFPESAIKDSSIIERKSQALEQLLTKCLASTLEMPKDQSITVEVVVTVQQDDGSLETVVINGLYLAIQQTIDAVSMKEEPIQLSIKDSFAAVTFATLSEGEIALDPDSTEEQQATFIAHLIMTESGEFIDLTFENQGSLFTIDRVNEVVTIGKATVETQLIKLKEWLYVDYSSEVDDKTIVVATNNPGKAKEFEALFAIQGYRVKTLKDFADLPDVAETGSTFEENAKLKAETIATILKMPVLADDSGLKVDALGGLPGVYSARFAGNQKSDAANNAKLMHELTGITDENRTAQFHCTLAFAAPDRETLVVEAEWPGRIGRIPRGEHGFGYDPLFLIGETSVTSAELLANEKNEISHRGQAIKKLATVWREWLEGER